MKICLITGERESGQCGIADYADLIALELKKLGHQIERYFISKSSGDLTDLPNADLYSIQFAPYAFAQNGIPNQTLKYLSKKLHNQKLHLNFHEIWVGAYPRASWKEKVIGRLQKNLIVRFTKKCKPAFITSSNSAAIDRLKLIGVHARFLYLFGNIPFSATSKVKPKGQTLKIALFGTLYTDFPYDKLGSFFSTLSKICGKKLEIILIGRQRENAGTDRVLSMCKKRNFFLERTGELNTDLISEHLQECSLGVSTTPYDVFGKSGATAAMLEHRLPVLAYDDEDTPKENFIIHEPFKDQIFLLNDDHSLEKLLHYIEKPRKYFFDGVAHTANKLLELVS